MKSEGKKENKRRKIEKGDVRQTDSESDTGEGESTSEGSQTSDSEENSDDEISAGDMHISDLTGRLPSGSYIPSSLPLHTTVSDKLKKKVWALKYVDFVKFLDVDEAPKKAKLV